MADIPGEGEAPSLRDTLSAEFDKLEQPETPAQEEVVETAEQKADRLRDEKGRFAPNSAQASDPKGGVRKDADTPKPVAESKPRPAVPKSWKADYHKHWEAVPPEVAEYINQREEEMSRGAELIKSDAKMGKELMAEINPYMEMIQKEGGTPALAIRDLLRTAATLRTADPVQRAQLLLQVGQQYGADFKSALSGKAPQPQAPQFDPRMVEKTIEEKLQSRFALEEVNRFKSDPTHEHFEALREMMGRLIQAEAATDLNDAYEKALRLHPDLFEATQAKAKQAEDEKRREEADKAAKAAKKTAVSPKTSTPASRAKPSGSGLRAQLEEAFDSVAGGRV